MARFLWLSLASILLACQTTEKKATIVEREHIRNASVSGKELSRKYCQSCHLYPQPELLDKHTWQRSVLPLMGRFFGIYESNVPRSKILDGAIDKNVVLRRNIFPDTQLIDNESWQKIVDYYVSSAPHSLTKSKPKDGIPSRLTQFEISIPAQQPKSALTTLVKVDPKTSNIYIGGTKGAKGLLTIMNKHFKIMEEIPLPTAPVDLVVNADRLAVTLIGSLRLAPSNNPPGQLLHIFRRPGETQYTSFTNFLDKLRRPLQAIFDDADGDGNDDIFIADFGYYTGAVNYYRYAPEKATYKKTVLKDAAGAMRMHLQDLNGDKRKDLAVLFAQGDEGISFFFNNGNGQFTEQKILSFNPAYGSVSFELADMNNDGLVDILYCNGDNGDYPPILKDYHGIRIFENKGSNNFQEVYFYPMDGAYDCSAEDFDRDGDLDIVGISYFPDPDAAPRNDLVYLENLGNNSFHSQSLQQAIPARWVTLDIADLDGNGYKDILLGAGGNDNVNKTPAQSSKNPSVVLLKNVGKQPVY